MVNSNSCTASFTQLAGIAALQGDQQPVHAMVAEFKRRRDIIVEGLNSLPGVSCRSPRGAFYVFPNVKKLGRPSAEVAAAVLSEAGVAVLGGSAFGEYGEGYLRLSYANSEANIRKALERMLRARPAGRLADRSGLPRGAGSMLSVFLGVAHRILHRRAGGAIGLLCIRRTVADGRMVGFVSGLGAATADAFMERWRASASRWCPGRSCRARRRCGSWAGCFSAISAYDVSGPSRPDCVGGRAPGVWGGLCLHAGSHPDQPVDHFSFVAIFAGLGLGSGGSDYASAGLLVAGVFIGSALWWLILSGTAGVLRGRLTPVGLRWMNRLSAVILAASGPPPSYPCGPEASQAPAALLEAPLHRIPVHVLHERLDVVFRPPAP